MHDILKPIRCVYLDSCGSKVDLIICKKRYHCYHCNKIFTEELNLNVDKGNISNKVKIQIRKDLINYNLSFKYIAQKNPCIYNVCGKRNVRYNFRNSRACD